VAVKLFEWVLLTITALKAEVWLSHRYPRGSLTSASVQLPSAYVSFITHHFFNISRSYLLACDDIAREPDIIDSLRRGRLPFFLVIPATIGQSL